MRMSVLLRLFLPAATTALCCAGTFAQPPATPFANTVAPWYMGDSKDAAGANSELKPAVDVSLGVELAGDDLAASLKRGGDGKVAEFRGGYLDAGQGADDELNLSGTAMSMCVRLRLAEGTTDTPIFSKHGGHDKLVYNLFCTKLGGETSLGFELGTDYKDQPLRVSVPLKIVGAVDWHDVIVRFTGPKLELFVDGVLVDEEWPIGKLRLGNSTPCLIGAESANGHVKCGFRGAIDHAALWNRALTNDEVVFLSGGADEVARRDAQILGPENPCMQYWKPRGYNTSLGDCMPFFHDGRFHLFYLFDRRHHGSKWGLGAHQWAHASSTDLAHWEQHPMAIPITEQWEGSICTGSVFFHDGVYYAHYATRMPDGKQHLAHATSTDGIHFDKLPPNPLASPQAGYDPTHYRDPLVFEENGLFHMLVTARFTDKRDGCVAQLLSKDLKTWDLAEPFIIPGRVTDCPDYFEWNGYHYLFAEFVYWMSREPLGPWTSPAMDRLDVLYVPKTAAFTGNRRIYVSWLPDGGWAGNAVFRELIQHEDGTLGTKFVPEMMPKCGGALDLASMTAKPGANVERDSIRAPHDMYLTTQVTPGSKGTRFGLSLHADADKGKGCGLWFDPAKQRVEFHADDSDAGKTKETNCAIDRVEGLDRPFTLEIVVKDDIIDVCIDHRRTIITRYKGDGEDLLFLTGDSGTLFDKLGIRTLEKGV